MNTFEKIYSVFAILFGGVFTWLLLTVPDMRQLSILIPVTAVGLLINVIMMFFVFRDIFSRTTLSRNAKLSWTVVVLLFWPAILVYLPLHGFRARTV